MTDLSKVPDALIPVPHPPGPLRPAPGHPGPRKINYPTEVILLPIHRGDVWEARFDPARKVIIRGLFEDRVLVFHVGPRRKGSILLDVFRKYYRKNHCPDPRLDRVLERLKDQGVLPSPMDWAEDVGPGL